IVLEPPGRDVRSVGAEDRVTRSARPLETEQLLARAGVEDAQRAVALAIDARPGAGAGPRDDAGAVRAEPRLADPRLRLEDQLLLPRLRAVHAPLAVPAPRRQPRPVRAEHGEAQFRGGFQHRRLAAAPGVEQTHDPVPVERGEARPVAAENNLFAGDREQLG